MGRELVRVLSVERETLTSINQDASVVHRMAKMRGSAREKEMLLVDWLRGDKMPPFPSRFLFAAKRKIPEMSVTGIYVVSSATSKSYASVPLSKSQACFHRWNRRILSLTQLLFPMQCISAPALLTVKRTISSNIRHRLLAILFSGKKAKELDSRNKP